MAYRNRYFIDSAGRWRDRKNHNRVSSGPQRKVDRRKYRVKTPTPWKPRKKPKPKPTPDNLLRHDIPDEYQSTFRHFIESVDKGHPNAIATCYAILKRTNARYITAENANGVRIFAIRLGDITRSVARKMTVADLQERALKFDTDWHPSIHTLKGKAMKHTPVKGDKTRSRLAKKYLRKNGEKKRKKRKGKAKKK